MVGHLDGLSGPNLSDGGGQVVPKLADAHLSHGHMISLTGFVMPRIATCGHFQPSLAEEPAPANCNFRQIAYTPPDEPDARRDRRLTRGAAARDLDADAALRVIANPAQRRVLEVVAEGEISSGALAGACGLTRAATSQHLRALREAALVEVRVDGNRRLYRARMENLARLRAFLDEFWAARLGVLASSIAGAQEQR